MARRLILFFGCLAGLQFLFAVVAFFHAQHTPARATLGMGIGLYLFWIILGGLLMHSLRRAICSGLQRIPLPWQITFVLSATAFAMLEEVVTVGMTHTARFHGMTMAQAHITASADYWDVVLTNSVVLLVPMFCIWAAILSRWRVSPAAVFLLWGATGTLMETLAGGPQHLIEIGMWMFVYGLMIYLPALAVPENRAVRQPRGWYYPLFILVGLLGIIPGGLLATMFRHLRPPHLF